MLHVDIPTQEELKELASLRHPACVSLYLPTHAVTQHTDIDRLELRRLAEEAVAQLRQAGHGKAAIAAIETALLQLREDDEFWRFQSNSLAVLVTPESLRSYRLPSRLTASVEVSDRLHLKPMARALSFVEAGFVLAFSQKQARLVHVPPDGPAQEVDVKLPRGVGAVVGATTGRTPMSSARISGEAATINATKFARAVEGALEPVLKGRNEPLILAATVEMASLYREVNSYPHLVDDVLTGNAEQDTARAIGERAQGLIRAFGEARIAALRARFAEARGTGRATSDLAHLARAATAGAVETLLVDIDGAVPGRIDEAGQLALADEASAESYDVVDELVDRTLAGGGAVLGVRRDDLPEPGNPAAALLRYPF